MKKQFIFSLLFCFVSLVHAQEKQSCPGDSIVEIKDGVVYYPKISEGKTLQDTYSLKITVVGSIGEPLINAKITASNSNRSSLTDTLGVVEMKNIAETENTLSIEHPIYKTVTMGINSLLANEDVAIQLTESKVMIPGVTTKPAVSTFWIRKPAIYLYPTSQTKVSVKHDFKGTVINTYPDYGNGWEVMADPLGKLLNLADNRNYGYLFWDGAYRFSDSHYNYKDGFYVKKGDYTSFLLDKLTLIGLNETEINDFIVYWLPSMNSYDEVFVHFWINDDIDNSSKLDITPKPDTMIRVFMEFGEYKGETKLPEQALTPNKRVGFTLLEWGGSEIGSVDIE